MTSKTRIVLNACIVGLLCIPIDSFASSLPPVSSASPDVPLESTVVQPGENHFTPIISAGLNMIKDEAKLKLSNGTFKERRNLWQTELGAGLRYQLPTRFQRLGRLNGLSLISVGVLFETGHWPLNVQQEFYWDVKFKQWFHLSCGISISARLNVSQFSQSYLNFGIPLSVRFGWFSLVYQPGFNVAISQDERDVYDGTMTRKTANVFIPISFFARFHLERLGW